MAIVDTTARVYDDGIRFIPERAREGRIGGFNTRTSRAIRRREEVARKVGIVEIPCDGGRRLAQIGGCLLVMEAPEDDTEQGGEAGEREGLESAGGTSAAVARKVVEGVARCVLVENLFKRHAAAHADSDGDPVEGRELISTRVTLEAFHRRQFKSAPVAVDHRPVELEMVMPVIGRRLEEALLGCVGLRGLALAVSPCICLIVKVSEQKGHELLSVLLLLATKLLNAPALIANVT